MVRRQLLLPLKHSLVDFSLILNSFHVYASFLRVIFHVCDYILTSIFHVCAIDLVANFHVCATSSSRWDVTSNPNLFACGKLFRELQDGSGLSFVVFFFGLDVDLLAVLLQLSASLWTPP